MLYIYIYISLLLTNNTLFLILITSFVDPVESDGSLPDQDSLKNHDVPEHLSLS
jgi:hypothetical protein